MSRNLLHKSKLEDFKLWLDSKGIKHRPGKGEFQVLQINNAKDYWNPVYERIDMPEHLTVVCYLEGIVKSFIRETKQDDGKRRVVRQHNVQDVSQQTSCASILQDSSVSCLAESQVPHDKFLELLELNFDDTQTFIDVSRGEIDELFETGSVTIKLFDQGKNRDFIISIKCQEVK